MNRIHADGVSATVAIAVAIAKSLAHAPRVRPPVPTPSPSTSELKDRLRGAGLRATASRIAVLDALQSASRPLSHAEVVDLLKDGPWDRATLYRNLIDLVGAELAQKVELGDRTWRFHSGGRSDHDAAIHPHFICTECGEVRCLPDVSVNVPRRGVPRSLQERHVEVQLRGVCDTCD